MDFTFFSAFASVWQTAYVLAVFQMWMTLLSLERQTGVESVTLLQINGSLRKTKRGLP